MAISLNDPGQTDLTNLFGQSVAENSGSEVEGLCLEVQERRNKINVPSLAEVAMTFCPSQPKHNYPFRGEIISL